MMLGDHVVQGGSLVEPGRLRFDFTHMLPVTPGELVEIEKIVNDEILRDLDVDIHQSTLEQAKAHGAMALFSEKYGGIVRVVKIGDFSMELCGGTHVRRTSQIGLFKIISESSVGAGLRRIEAVTGAAALEHMRERDRILSEMISVLKVQATDAPEAVSRLVESLKTAEKEISGLQQKSALSKSDNLMAEAADFNGVHLVAARVDIGDVDLMSALADDLAGKLKSGVIVLGGPSDSKVAFVCKVTQDLVKRGFSAGNIIREVARVAGGGGGGRPDFAQAGGKDAGKLDAALAKARELVSSQAAKA
jgi:alanyl-tRNA synthetase